ncbi:MAG: nucleoside triphosphate pyrophosphohydrolase [Actinomycetota bacterium]|nr:nucleoside triphosphate pyrophosphohydrolase [Actinomycetota bacterium]
MARLLLVDTADELPGLLPLHAWSALMTSDLVIVGSPDHPFVPHLQAAELRLEALPQSDEAAALSRVDLLGGLSPTDKRRAEQVVDRVRQVGEVAYLYGAGDTEAFTRTLGMEAARAGVEVEVVYFTATPKGAALLDLVRVMERLRQPDGCPWDREQTHRSLARYAVEEVYELLDAIESDDPDAVREELGDVLLQVVFHAQVAEDRGSFGIDEVARDIVDKLVRRHPHVFSDVQVADAAEVVANWEQLKAAEDPEREDVFAGIPTAQPALGYSAKLQARAAKLGFDQQAGADREARRAIDAVLAAQTDQERADRLGELLMSVVGLARRHGIDPEGALRGAARAFRARFEAVLATAQRPVSELSRADWLRLWERAEAPAGERSSG